jgi:hypothetical protein
MKLSGRLLIIILIVVFLQGQAPPVTGAQAQGNSTQSTVTLQGHYIGWIEIDINLSWDKPAPAQGVTDNYFSFNYVRSRGRLEIQFDSGTPQKVNIDLRLPFYLIIRQRTIAPDTPADLCQGFSSFTRGRSRAGYAGRGDGNSMLFNISGFTFMPDSTEASVAGTGGDCTSGMESARLATIVSAEKTAMLPESFPWTFETTHWTEDLQSIGGSCSSAEYEKHLGAAVQCFWGANMLLRPSPLVEPPQNR